MSGRDAVLRAIRSALADVRGDETPSDGAARAREDLADGNGAEVVDLFAERVADYRATVVRVSPAGAAAAVGRALARGRAGSCAVPPGFPADLMPKGPWSVLTDVPPLTVGQLDAVDAVVTTAAAAIAVTGTVVLDGGRGQGRRALTLLPDQHICVVRAGQIVLDVPRALRLLDPSRPLTLVSGPSATSDIELDRVEGVHGPRTLDVVVIMDT
ncbi:lactate utilization protein C [Streptomyces antibioticus]|uniref:LutC/YkgG family protein n=1 Tax=Streptomyces antibioticus TaxID=1890 RepID=UPI0036C21833